MRIAAALTLTLACLAAGDPAAQTLTVAADADLQDALNRAKPGDTVPDGNVNVQICSQRIFP